MNIRPRRRRSTTFVGAILGILMAAGVLIPIAAPTQSAAAASASDWDPGFIIADSVFYDSGAMTANEVQTFLNSRVRACASSFTCLKDYRQTTDNRSADRYCDGYTAGVSETAATIIDKVARSCGISQRVLLVILEKEQGLVSATTPTPRAYAAATGQGCPDTAPCDPSTQGFFYQVYYAARQYEIYRLNPNSFGYLAQRWNNILYHPDSKRACGTQRVFIQNQATAALYIYTPYVPNTAALSNMYGTGDSCSSYGNRNFWRLFTDWFGDPRRFAVHPGFAAPYEAAGGANGYMGIPIANAVYIEANGQGWYQRFSGGTIYGSYAGGTQWVANNAILKEYVRQGGPGSGMGWPTADQQCATGLRCFQTFLSASISTTSAYGAHVTWGGIDQYWRSSGAAGGSLGLALNDVVYRQTATGAAWMQNFERGVFVESGTGKYLVPYSPLLDRWLAAGAGESWLGWPRGEYSCTADGCAQSFSGAILTSGKDGVRVVSGGFIGAWEASGGLRGYGPAQTELATIPSGWTQRFSLGIVAQGGAGIFLVPNGAGQNIWSAAGGSTGTYGLPRSARSCDEIGCVQSFYGGAISESSWGNYGTFGGLGAYWLSNGAQTKFGPALNDIRYSAMYGGGWAQHFGRGVVTQTRAGQPIFTAYGPIINMWYRYGAEVTWLGWPTAEQTCAADRCTQPFQNGDAVSEGQSVAFTPR